MILLRTDGDAHEEVVFGLTEGEIHHKEGMITKDEVRAVSLHRLRLPLRGVLWDIGAGSGSVSIEAARLSPFLRVYAIERDPDMVEIIRTNRDRLGSPNLEILRAEAPDGLDKLPRPDRVFIGGSGGRLREILGTVSALMEVGIIVANITRVEALSEAMEVLKKENFLVDVTQVSVSRGVTLGGLTHLRALNPVFVLRAGR